MAWVGNDHWEEHLRIWGLTEQTSVNQIWTKNILGGCHIAGLSCDFHSLSEAPHHTILKRRSTVLPFCKYSLVVRMKLNVNG
jgi:hypothetical protein